MSSYEGDMLEGEPHGKGRGVRANGEIYTGEWQDGEPHGYGALSSADGELIYEGEWRHGMMHGRNTFKSPASMIPTPLRYSPTAAWIYGCETVAENTLFGTTSKSFQLATYQGEVDGGRPCGRGILVVHAVADGVANATGTKSIKHELSSGGTYDGEWLAGLQHGIGTCTYSDGRSFTGEWISGLPINVKTGAPLSALSSSAPAPAPVRTEFPAATAALPGLTARPKDPFRTLPSVDMNLWDSLAQDWAKLLSSQHKNATTLVASELTTLGDYYYGELSADNGEPCGLGVSLFLSGDKYSGYWKNGEPHGFGKMSNALGFAMHEGLWNNGNPMKSENEIVKNGLSYKGELVDGEPNGKGIGTFFDGKSELKVYEGGSFHVCCCELA
jgi:hypothetical protein